MKKKIFVLYGPGGNGHRSGAQTIKEAFERKYPEHEVIIEDVIEIANTVLKFALSIYDNLIKADPKYVKYGFNLLNTMKTDKVLTPLFPKTIAILADRIKEINPDMVISVHSGINHFIVEALKKLGRFGKTPFIIVCTDLTDNFLNSWVHVESDLMIGFLEETKRQLVAYGMPAEKIKVLGGPPVNPIFSDNTLTKAQARQKFGLDDGEIFTVLIMSGGIGLKTIYTFTKQLLNSSLPVQLIVCCGRNDKLKEKVDKLAKYSKKPIKVFGFTDQVHNLMDAADVIVTKPGPGVIAEAIVKELPIVLDGLSEIMPQEAGNVEYVLSNGVGKKIGELSKFHNHIASFIYNEDELPTMRANMKRLKQTESSGKLVAWLNRILEEGVTSDFIKDESYD
ncbi:hypothetical protein EON78_04665, partial [bacterium]